MAQPIVELIYCSSNTDTSGRYSVHSAVDKQNENPDLNAGANYSSFRLRVYLSKKRGNFSLAERRMTGYSLKHLGIPLKASFHSGKLSVDWNGQENYSLSCELWGRTNDFNTKLKNFLSFPIHG